MEFTAAYKQSGPCAFSPNARFLAVAVDYRLVIRDVLSLKVVQLFSCLDKITYIEWALDSQYIHYPLWPLQETNDPSMVTHTPGMDM